MKDEQRMEYDGKTRLCGLIGNPVEHTMSPLIHNTLARLKNQNLVYVPFHVKENLSDAVKGAYALNVLGMNVTVPYKSDVMESIVDIDELAERIGAVNTLVRTSNGYKGYNTDMPGLLRGMQSDGIEIAGKDVVIVGAGGVARAVAVLCAFSNVRKVYLMNRTVSKAEAIANEVNNSFQKEIVMALGLHDYDSLPDEKMLAIQCTNMGMHPDVDSTPIEDAAFFEKIHTVYDLIYNPEETKFMKLAKSYGAKAYNGLKMLLYQGIIAFELWTDTKVSKEEADYVYRILKLRGKECKHLILIGYMGSGKSTLGIKLSYRLQTPFLDTDKQIEREQGISISDIFANHGEAYFRDLETNQLEKIKKETSTLILSTGGGLPMRQENRKLLKEMGMVVYLKASFQTIYDRVKTDTTRPLLQCDNPKEKIEKMLLERGPFYEEAADVIIETDGKTCEEVLSEIIMHWNV